MLDFLVVGIGGSIGSCIRFAFSKIANYYSVVFPFGTLMSNIIAGFFIGLIIGAEQHSIAISPKTKLFLTTGLLGGLSTFSTFSLETVNFFNQGKLVLAVGNIVLNLALSLLGVVAGMYITELIFVKS